MPAAARIARQAQWAEAGHLHAQLVLAGRERGKAVAPGLIAHSGAFPIGGGVAHCDVRADDGRAGGVSYCALEGNVIEIVSNGAWSNNEREGEKETQVAEDCSGHSSPHRVEVLLAWESRWRYRLRCNTQIIRHAQRGTQALMSE